MLAQLLIGSGIVCVSMVVHALFLTIAIATLRRFGVRVTARPSFAKTLGALIVTTLWLLAAHTVSVWLWAVAFLQLGIFAALEPALYFSLVAFTTLGFGDIILPTDWRLLSGISAANGLLLFGFSSAFLFEVMARLHGARRESARAAAHGEESVTVQRR